MPRAHFVTLALVAASAACSTLFPPPTPVIGSADAAAQADGALVAGADAQLADAAKDAGAGVTSPDGCNPTACPLSSEACRTPACVDGACGFVPGSGGVCDDGDPCTAYSVCTDGVCQGSGARSWLSMFGAGAGGRLSDVAPGPDGSLLAVGSDPAPTSGYDALIVRADGVGRQVFASQPGVASSDDLVALTPLLGGGVAAVGYANGSGRIVWAGPDGALKLEAKASVGGARYDDVAALGDGMLVVAGTGGIQSPSGPGFIDAFDAAGKLAWTHTRAVPGKRVAVTRVAAALPKAKPSLVLAALGYDRTLPPGGSGADLYDIWVEQLDAKGAPGVHTVLAAQITGAASGLVARDNGAFVALIDRNGALDLYVLDAAGKASQLASLVVGGPSIDTASDLAAAPAGGVYIARDGFNGPATLLHVDASGKLLQSKDLATPQAMRTRVFGLAALGGSAVALSGDVMLQVKPSSSTSWRAFLRRVDLADAAGCPAADACFGDTHACAAPAPCQVPYCDAVSGCQLVQLAAAVCAP